MAVCEVCGKKVMHGRKVTFSAKRNPRLFKPNIQKIRVKLSDGSIRRLYVCTKCIKAGKVFKAAKTPKES